MLKTKWNNFNFFFAFVSKIWFCQTFSDIIVQKRHKFIPLKYSFKMAKYYPSYRCSAKLPRNETPKSSLIHASLSYHDIRLLEINCKTSNTCYFVLKWMPRLSSLPVEYCWLMLQATPLSDGKLSLSTIDYHWYPYRLCQKNYAFLFDMLQGTNRAIFAWKG